MENENARSAKGQVLNTDQPLIVISSLTTSKISKWADKCRAFWKFRVNFRVQELIKFFWKWILLKNIKLEDQLSLTWYLVLFVFKKLYLANVCPIFVSSFPNFGESWEGNNYLGLISVQNFTFCWMGNFFLQSLPDSTVHSSLKIWKNVPFDTHCPRSHKQSPLHQLGPFPCGHWAQDCAWWLPQLTSSNFVKWYLFPLFWKLIDLEAQICSKMYLITGCF